MGASQLQILPRRAIVSMHSAVTPSTATLPSARSSAKRPRKTRYLRRFGGGARRGDPDAAPYVAHARSSDWSSAPTLRYHHTKFATAADRAARSAR